MAEITEENYPEYKRLYEEALKEKQELFVFQGQEVLCCYAKYVCEYTDSLRKEQP